MEEIIKVTTRPKIKTTDRFTSDFRDLLESKLGELDTATSLMYFFRRFGAPNESNEDEYKILYCYYLKYKDLHISVHASYHKHVCFNIFAKENNLKEHYKKITSAKRAIFKKCQKANIVYCPFTMIFSVDGLTKKQIGENGRLFTKQSETFFTPEENAFTDEYENTISCKPDEEKQVDFERYCILLDKYLVHLNEKFNSIISQEERDLAYRYRQLDDFPEIKEMCLGLIEELKRGFYVRDVPINILGYESEQNKIINFEIEEE